MSTGVSLDLLEQAGNELIEVGPFHGEEPFKEDPLEVSHLLLSREVSMV